MAGNKPLRPTLDLFEEAFIIVKHLPLPAYGAYVLGVAPFLFGAIFFFADMRYNAFAGDRLFVASLALAVLFIWMRVWQSVYCRFVRAKITGETGVRITPLHVLKTVIFQTMYIPSALLAIPVATVFVVPSGVVWSFYQTVTIYGYGETQFGELWKTAIRNAVRFPGQSFVLFWSFVLFALFLYINFMAIFFLVPMLLRMLLSVETLIVRLGPGRIIGNETFLFITALFTYAALDPYAKALFTLRTFYEHSRETGADLIRSFREAVKRNASVIALVVFGSLAVANNLPAQTTPETADPLHDAIEEVISRSEYGMRLPRPKPEPAEQETPAFLQDLNDFLLGIRESIEETTERFFEWLRNVLRNQQLPETDMPELPGGFPISPRIIVIVLISVGALIFAMLLIRALRSPKSNAIAGSRVRVDETPEAIDTMNADDLPEDEWMLMAEDYLKQADLRRAMRALYHASLVTIEQAGFISIERYKSIRNYTRELALHSRRDATLTNAFAHNARSFEEAWYGMYPVVPETITEAKENVQLLRGAHAEA